MYKEILLILNLVLCITGYLEDNGQAEAWRFETGNNAARIHGGNVPLKTPPLGNSLSPNPNTEEIRTSDSTATLYSNGLITKNVVHESSETKYSTYLNKRTATEIPGLRERETPADDPKPNNDASTQNLASPDSNKDALNKECCNDLTGLEARLNDILVIVIFIAAVVIILLCIQFCFACCMIRTLKTLTDNPDDDGFGCGGGNKWKPQPSILKPSPKENNEVNEKVKPNERGSKLDAAKARDQARKKKVSIVNGNNPERTPLLQKSDDESTDDGSKPTIPFPPKKDEDNDKGKEEIDLKPIPPTTSTDADKIPPKETIEPVTPTTPTPVEPEAVVTPEPEPEPPVIPEVPLPVPDPPEIVNTFTEV